VSDVGCRQSSVLWLLAGWGSGRVSVGIVKVDISVTGNIEQILILYLYLYLTSTEVLSFNLV
jgi:hypothetical protein